MKEILLVLLLTLALGCDSSPVSDSWRDPMQSSPIRFQRTIVIAMMPDVAVRRAAENEMVRLVGEGRSVQSYKLLSDADLSSADAIRAKFAPNGVDGILAMRFVAPQHDVTWVPGNEQYPFDPFWSYYDRAWPAARDPEYLKTDTSVRMQTNLYSGDGKLIWSGISDSFNIADSDAKIASICQSVAGQMDREGLLK